MGLGVTLEYPRLPGDSSEKKNVLSNVIYIILVVVLLTIGILLNIFTISRVEGTSMLSTILDDDYVISVEPNKLTRGEIITVDADGTKIIKRIVGVPGDKLFFLNLCDGKVPFSSTVIMYRDIGDGNGFVAVDESEFINKGVMTEEGFYRQNNVYGREFLFVGEPENVSDDYIIIIDKDEYFVMGDNRDNSSDSRHYGKFEKKDIMGRVVAIATPGQGLYKLCNFVYDFFGSFRVDKITSPSGALIG